MSDTQFTPGPWKVEQDADFPFHIRTVTASGEVVESCPRWAIASRQITLDDCMAGVGFSGEDREQAVQGNARQLADMHLRASAPDLYAKLEDCVKRLRRCALLGGSGPEMVDGLCEQFEQALARARGDVR